LIISPARPMPVAVHFLLQDNQFCLRYEQPGGMFGIGLTNLPIAPGVP
jgi:hypothetical protein